MPLLTECNPNRVASCQTNQTIMVFISIQCPLTDSWEKTKPVFHEIKDQKQAIDIAYAVSLQLGCATVRLVTFDPGEKPTVKKVLSRSGSYLQSHGECTSPTEFERESV